MRIFIVGLFFAVAAVAIVLPVHAASDPGGFFGLKWSQSPSECKKANLCTNDTVTTEDLLKTETILKGKATVIEGVNLRWASFAFNNSKFYMGTGAFDSSKEAYEALKAVLTKKFGKPTALTDVATSWTVGNTRVLLSNDNRTGALIYASVPLWNEVSKAKKYPPYKPQVKK
jgi:hypothetical protein